jgi:uncharacterized protein (DUF1786 family)
MQILTVDVGTGTQDILLFDSLVDLENSFKLVVPSPTMMVHQRIREATRRGDGILLSGVTMGGGPSHWAARDHAQAGYPIYATPDAARTFDDNLDLVAESGILVISEDEAASLAHSVLHLELRDFDFELIAKTFEGYGVPMKNLDAVAVAVFDHGAAPPEISDRQFRFDYLDERIRENSSLSTFAFLAKDVPPIMTRLGAVVASAQGVDAPLIVMDTAPAAVLGASFDPVVRARPRVMIANVGNFHTLAFRLGQGRVEGVFEHHTGLIDLPKLESFLRSLADGSLTHESVFDDHGHGALIYEQEPLILGSDNFDVVVTGPRRSMFSIESTVRDISTLRPYFAAPFGDMMIAGCFGLLAAVADLCPTLRAPIQQSLAGIGGHGRPPWEVRE